MVGRLARVERLSVSKKNLNQARQGSLVAASRAATSNLCSFFLVRKLCRALPRINSPLGLVRLGCHFLLWPHTFQVLALQKDIFTFLESLDHSINQSSLVYFISVAPSKMYVRLHAAVTQHAACTRGRHCRMTCSGCSQPPGFPYYPQCCPMLDSS